MYWGTAVVVAVVAVEFAFVVEFVAAAFSLAFPLAALGAYFSCTCFLFIYIF